jgi:hypothetical protein
MTRFYIFKGAALFLVSASMFKAVATPVLRKATGWKDWNTQEVNDEAIEEFIKKHDGKPV